MSRFEGRVAVVTGAGAGIGATVASRLASEGACVLAFDRDADALEAQASAISAHDGVVLPIAGDVRSLAAVRSAVAAADREFGGVDLLANVAGVIRFSAIEEADEAVWDEVLDINLRGAFRFTASCVPLMRRRGGGAIVNIASVLAFVSGTGTAAYSASKAGVHALTMTTAVEHARDNIRCNAVAPGNVHTPMIQANASMFAPDDTDGALEEWGRAHLTGRLIQADEVGANIVHLLSDDAAAVTGACWRVDAGMLARMPVSV